MSSVIEQTHELEIEMVPVAALKPHARNPRQHSAKQIGQIARSIREFGFTNPIFIDADGGVIAGHGRIQAAKELGIALPTRDRGPSPSMSPGPDPISTFDQNYLAALVF